jgi:hypothetical protein
LEADSKRVDTLCLLPLLAKGRRINTTLKANKNWGSLQYITLTEFDPLALAWFADSICSILPTLYLESNARLMSDNLTVSAKKKQRQINGTLLQMFYKSYHKLQNKIICIVETN